MKFLFCLLCFQFIITNLCSQTLNDNSYNDRLILKNESSGSNPEDEVLYTPFGPALKSRIHFIDGSHHLNIQNGITQIIQTMTGNVESEIRTSTSKRILDKENTLVLRNKNNLYSEITNGWISWAMGYVQEKNPSPITYYSVSYVVPSSPKSESGQLIYLFSGMENSDSTGFIVQPVLQWGVSPAGGGKYWAICNWCVSSDTTFYHDSLIRVEPGTRLQGIIEMNAFSESSFNYKSYFKGHSPGLQINNLPMLNLLTVALETYFVKSCDEFPYDEKIRFTDIEVRTESLNPLIYWQTNSEIPACRQFTRIVNGNSKHGEINIHLRKPVHIDNYTDFHFYPNPVENRLHVSPNRPVFNCSVTVYNSTGKLVNSEFHQYLDYEFDFDTTHLSSGQYFIRLIYHLNNDDDFMKNHVFRFIKL